VRTEECLSCCFGTFCGRSGESTAVLESVSICECGYEMGCVQAPWCTTSPAEETLEIRKTVL
jgi:hypothetical protein